MATLIQLRRDTAANWANVNPTLAQGEVGIDLTNNKIKIGNGVQAWNSLVYFDDKETVFGNVAGDIIPDADGTRSLGSPSKQWKEIFVAEGSIYVGNIKLSNDNGQLVVQQVSNPGQVTEAPVPGVPGVVTTDRLINGQNTLVLKDNGTIELNGQAFTGGSGATGPQGPAGPQGETGAIGPQGEPGADALWNFLGVYSDLNIYVEGDIVTHNGETWYRNDVSNSVSGYAPGGGTFQNDPPYWIKLAAKGDTGDGGTGNFSGSYNDLTDKPTIPTDISDLTDSEGLLEGEGLPTVTIPGEIGTTYKGLQVSYGRIHSNSSSSEINVSKIVIHKPAVTTTEIDPTSSQDYFRVSGLDDSDVLAMFVIFGDINGPKPLSDLQAFAQSAIDNVILDGGVEGQYNTVDQMRLDFYTNYATLATAAGGLDADFQFYETFVAATTGTTTVREGSGATFSVTVAIPGDPYATASQFAFGTNYRVGHKVKLSGADLGGTTPENDVTITVTSVDGDGGITGVSFEGTSNAGAPPGTIYNGISGTNFNVGSGFNVLGISVLTDGSYSSLNLSALGSQYVVGDVLTLSGANLTNGVSPENDITITIQAVDGSGVPSNWNVSGTIPRVWPNNSISDGGNDQYDTANYINSFYAANIQYNQGITVLDGTGAFGAGSSYSFVYNTGIFGLLVTGNQSTFIETNGNSGADGSSATEAGNLYGPNTASQTFDNAVTHINIVSQVFAGPIVSFTRPDNSDQTIDILIPDDGDGAGVAIARDSGGNGIFNPYREGSWDDTVSPGGTLWNTDGWNDFSNITSRTYQPLYAAFGSGGLGNKIVGAECVMYLPDNGKYYAVKFDSWTQGGNGGGFSYTRREFNLTKLQEGIRFPDGTRLKSAAGVGRVKLESPGSRRIEEIHGYKTVSVSQRNTVELSTVASRAATGDSNVWFDVTTTTIDEIFDNPANYQVWDSGSFEFSLDNITWYRYTGSISFVGNERGISTTGTLTYNQGDTIYFRYTTGAQPAVWWDKADLPGGASNFRGAVIDYHAYSGEATWIGTIHIVDDSGEEHISHTEVGSGSTDSENDDLWVVQNEGTISYRRIDGESKTLKVQWSARVFYGSEYYD